MKPALVDVKIACEAEDNVVCSIIFPDIASQISSEMAIRAQRLYVTHTKQYFLVDKTNIRYSRMDESVDTKFYAMPRLVNHIDDNAILNLRKYYGTVIKPGSKVLDVASSWVSHLPDDLKLESVAGIGLNQAELNANERLNGGRHVQDLNKDTQFPKSIAAESTDAVICNVSIDYLTDPRAICLESARVLRPGGTLHLAISNRCFPTKVISRWLKVDEETRLQMVADYLHFAADEEGKRQVFRDIQIVQVVKPWWGADPLHVVRGTKC